MSEWLEVTLEEVAEDVTVGHVGPMASEYLDSGIPFLRSLSVEQFRIKKDGLKFISPEFHKRLQKSALSPGDVVIVRTGKPGACAVVPDWLNEANCSDLVIVRCGEKLRPRFLCYVVNSIADHHIDSHLVGAVQQHFNVGSARTLRFALPELKEQDAILSVLGALDDKIELNRRMNETLEAMARAIFRDWFVDFGATRAKMDVREPYLAPDLWALFPDRLDDDGTPEGWRKAPIGELSDIVGGATPSTKNPEFWECGTHAWATPKDLSKREGLFLYETDRSITDAGLAAISSGLSPAGSVLLSSRAPIGYLAIAEQPTAVNQGFIVLRPTEDLPTAFAMFWCQSNLEMIKANANGSTFQEISKRNFRPLKVVAPDRATMNAFIGVVSPLLDRIRLNGRENRTLAATRDLLLPRLMSGEIRVAEAEKQAEEVLEGGAPQLEAGASP